MKAKADLEPLNTEVNTVVWEAFRLLNKARDELFEGIAGLKISEMSAMLNILGVTDHKQRNRMIRLLSEMDTLYKSWRKKHG